MGRVLRKIAPVAIASVVVAAGGLPAAAQTLNDQLATRMQGQGQDRLLVEAKELVYDNDKNTISAVGDVELYYQGRTLQADRVTYDRASRRVFATGNAKLTETDGTVISGDRFELTEDFKNGFIDSLRVQRTSVEEGRPVTTRFSSARAERNAGETMTFDRGTYTACEPCKDNPERPPLWQVKASRIIHNNTERTVYYEDARIEFWGIPVAYIPYFSTPDPTVRRKTGFLTPTYIASSSLGTGAATPFFWALAPNYDLTITPTFLSRQGVMGQVEWRHRLINGSYNIRVAGIHQADPSAFLPAPLGAQDKDIRGSIESAGRFFINDKWHYGWDIALLSDKWFLQNYRVRSESISSTYFKESTSTVYLTGKGDRGYFDLRGFYFQPLSYTDWQKHQPLVHPVLDYNKRFQGPGTVGGEVELDFNMTSITRDAAQFQQIPRQTTSLFIFPNINGSTVGIYEGCVVYQKGQCIVRGIGGSTTRLSASVGWRRNFIDPLGQVWQPFASFRLDGFWMSPDVSRYQNANQVGFYDTDAGFVGRAMPAVGVTYRFPFVAHSANWGTHVFEPIAQIVARPNESQIGRLPNEDAQSLVFDDTSIFEWNKFSGYDRAEGGVRANVGVQYSVTTDSGGYANLLFGQSYQVAGRNSFSKGDLANTGLDSGLETRRSDYVARAHYSPNQNLSFTGRGRFDEQDFSMQRLELQTTFRVGPLSSSVMYARYAAQPNLGYSRRKEGVLASATYNITSNWYVTGSVLVDLDKYLQERELFISNPTAIYKGNRYDISSMSLGAGYTDECTTFGVVYTSSYSNAATGAKERQQAVMLRLELRTLGEASYRQAFGAAQSTQDGISQ